MRREEPIKRRDFLSKVAIVFAGAAVVWIDGGRTLLRAVSPALVELSCNSTPVVSIHMDRPYLDATGRAVPYYAPIGMRSGEPVAHLTEEAFRSQLCFV